MWDDTDEVFSPPRLCGQFVSLVIITKQNRLK